LGYAQEIAKISKTQDVLLITHTKGQLDGTSLSDHLGASVTKALLTNRQVKLPSGASLRHGTQATLRYSSGKSVVIANYADAKLLDFVDSKKDFVGIVAVPWTPSEIDQWCQRWSPIVHGEEQKAPTKIINDPVVEAALRSITGNMNLSHSVVRPYEKDWAKDAFRILRAKGHTIEAAKVKNWAVREGWKPKAADELAKIADKIANMKTKPRLAEIHDPEGRYERWKAS
jgi:hypothetical protein